LSTLTPAERHMLTLTKRGYEDAVIAQTFGMKIAEMRAMREAAEKKLRLQATPDQGGEWWDK